MEHQPRNFQEKLTSPTYLPFLLSNPKILKDFPTTFPTKVKPTKCSAKEKKQTRQQKGKNREGEKGKRKSRKFA